MKKLLFIIPKTLSFPTLIFLFLTHVTKSVNAQTNGCHVSYVVSERLYYTPYPAQGSNAWITLGNIDASGATGGYNLNNSTTYGCIADIGPACTVYQHYLMNDGITVGVRVYRNGVMATIDPINCSIDDYVPVLFIFTFGIFFLVLRKKIPPNQHQ